MASNLIELNRGVEAVPTIDECLRRAAGEAFDPRFSDLADKIQNPELPHAVADFAAGLRQPSSELQRAASHFTAASTNPAVPDWFDLLPEEINSFVGPFESPSRWAALFVPALRDED
jgi:hypothetical protein